MKRSILTITVAVAVVLSSMFAGTAISQDGSRDMAPWPEGVIDIGQSSDGRQTAILQYDDGFPQYRDGSTGPFPDVLFIGNYVSAGLTQLPGPNPPFTVTAASVNMAGFYGTRFFMAFFKGPGHPSSPLRLIDIKTIGVTNYGWIFVPFATPVVTSHPFLVGVVQTNFAGCSGNTALSSTCEGVALGPGTNQGHGHNAMRITYPNGTGTIGTSYAPINTTGTAGANKNALIRLNFIIPVELMRFEVE